jgi:hypothetical protein
MWIVERLGDGVALSAVVLCGGGPGLSEPRLSRSLDRGGSSTGPLRGASCTTVRRTSRGSGRGHDAEGSQQHGHALVTGASSGIGLATALDLRRAGHTVYGAGRRVSRMELFGKPVATHSRWTPATMRASTAWSAPQDLTNSSSRFAARDGRDGQSGRLAGVRRASAGSTSS